MGKSRVWSNEFFYWINFVKKTNVKAFPPKINSFHLLQFLSFPTIKETKKKSSMSTPPSIPHLQYDQETGQKGYSVPRIKN